ncbi:MAG: hypothetical protein ACI9DF_003952 [Verrucomicrobiales bacterium]
MLAHRMGRHIDAPPYFSAATLIGSAAKAFACWHLVTLASILYP